MQYTSINHIQLPRLAIVLDIDGDIDATREKKVDQNSNKEMDSGCQESTDYSIERFCEFDRRVEFSTVSVPECFIKSELSESTKMLSNQKGRLELQSEIDQKDPQQSLLMADSCLREQTKEITGTTINSNSNYRYSRIGMGLNFSDSESDVDGCRQVEQQLAFEQQQLTGNSCSLGIPPIICTNSDTREDQVSNIRDRQQNSGVLITKMKSIFKQNTSDQSNIQIARSIEDQSSDCSHSWSTEQLSGCIEQTGLERRLQNQSSDSLRDNAKTLILPLTRCLRNSNRKIMSKVLLAIEGQKC
ncbi:MAG: hypothetical protein EZS28_005338 [Streblomastix strix]|uniref:Uncharacterized protein n=1 Tax=Streblomastix strix TaxID=222440 RepID=A0A5J4WVZ4_9EUKA|nr:MAG: hypothetical protein EZS28_005338 [Streblomastix strix]